MSRLGIFTFLSAAAVVFTQPALSYQYFGTKTSYFVTANTEDRSVDITVKAFANAFDQVLVEAPKLNHNLHLQLLYFDTSWIILAN